MNDLNGKIKEKGDQFSQTLKPDKQINKNNADENKAANKKRYWTTKEMADDFNREEILRTTIRDFFIYAFFIIFVTIYAIGIRNRALFYLTKSLSQEFTEKSFYTINGVEIDFKNIRTAADVWFYLEEHLLRSLYWEYSYNVGSKEIEVDENAMNILGVNKVLGVTRIRQVRMSNDSCVIHEYFRRLFLSCFATYSSKSEDKKPFGLKEGTAWIYTSHQETRSLSYTSKISTYGGGGFYMDLATNRTQTQDLIQNLKENLWITQGTRAVFVDFSVYNGNVNLFAVCKLIFEFPAVGGVIPSSSINSMTLIRFQNNFDYFVFACECCFYGFILFYFIEEVRDLTYFRWKYFTKFWSYVDLTIIILAILNAIASIYKLLIVPSSIEKIKQNLDKYGNLEELAHVHKISKDILAVDLFLIYIKVFKFLNFNRTMGQLNNTLRKCALDILGFSLMFFIIFFAFAELGYLLFGDKVESFSHFKTAMFTLLRTILGDFDYSELSEANRILAPIFFISYIFLVFFVLLNMFLAIINDTYSDVKTEIAIAPDEMQMTEYLKNCLNTFFKKCGCNLFGSSSKEKQGEINATIRHIREALKRCDYSDLEIEMFFARYNIHPLANVHIQDVDKLKEELESLLSESDDSANFVKLEDFLNQQEKLDQMDKTLYLLVEQVKHLLQKLEQMDNVRKEGLIKK